MSEVDSSPQFPIGEVARRTGLSPHVLRAWERRYGAVEPGRREGGGRLYSPADILRFRLLRRLTEAGHPIGQVASLATEALVALLPADEGETPSTAVPLAADEPGDERYMTRALAALEGMNGEALRAVLMQAAVALSSREFFAHVVLPLLHRTGDLWAEGRICPAHEHLLSAQLLRVLGWVASAIPVPARARDLVVATPAGQRHEIGALLAAIVAAEEGWRVSYLGPDLPPGDVVTAVGVLRARSVLLSVVTDGEEATDALRQVGEIRAGVGAGVDVIVGGRAVAGRADEVAAAGGTYLPHLDALRAALGARALAEVPA
jgi:DNA-binding transcriptional MerR regulator/methylmalonyl-CoA mutase cobalamin-binding subunit